MTVPKLCNVLRLREQGWTEISARLAPHSPESELQYHLDLKLPASYFAALCDRASVFRKNVDAIHHRKADNYYRCLLLLSESKLSVVLDGLALGSDDSWFLEQLHLCDDAGVRETLQPQVIAAETAVVLAIGDIPCIVAPVVAHNEWTRCSVHVDGFEDSLKIYFDNCSHQTGKRRGWANCDRHGCIKYVFTTGLERKAFCASMFLWWQHNEHDLTQTKCEHLAFWPDSEAVLQLLPSVRLVSF